MPNQTITLPPGVVVASSPSVTRGRWRDANMIRWRGPHLQPIGGWQDIGATAALASPPRRIIAWRDLDDTRRVAFLCDRHIYTLEGSTYTNHTPAGYGGATGGSTDTGGYGIGPYGMDFYGTPRDVDDPTLFLRPGSWSLDTFGEDLLSVASSDGRLFLLSPGAVAATGTTPRALPPAATVITAAPIANRAMLVTEERHVMLFGAGGNPRRVAWCSRENYNDWDFASTTNTAGYFDIECSGWIVHATKVRGGILIFTDDEVWLARYRGVPFVYGFERIGRACSVIAPQAFATAAGVCVWMGREGFWVFDGGTVRSLPCDVEEHIYNHRDKVAASVTAHGGSNGLFTEAWFFYPAEGSQECDRFVIWSPQGNGNWWSIGKMSRTAMLEAGVYPYPLMTNAAGRVFQHEDGWTDAGKPRTTSIYAETGALAIPQSGDRTFHVMSGQIDIDEDRADRLGLRAYARMTHDGPEEVYGPYTPRTDGYTDMRLQGRDVRVRVECLIDGMFSIGEMRLDVRRGSGQ